MFRSLRTLAAGAVLVATLTSCSTSGSESSPDPSGSGLPRQTQDALQQVLISAQDDLGFPGVIAGVWSPSGEWVGTAGTTGADTQAAPTPSDHTRIGSVTKTFTVTALLQQVERGTMSLADPIEKYVPGLPNGRTATLRDLAQMTSGIPSYTQNRAWGTAYFADTASTYTAQQLVDYVKGKKPMFPAGKKFYYSNTNTVALGMAIAQATGKPLETVLADDILGPLGLTGTSWPGQSAELPQPYLSGVTEQGLPVGTEKDATMWNPSWGNAAGEMISTLDDLHTWGTALGTGKGILEPSTQKLRLRALRQNLAIPGNSRKLVYGLGMGRMDGWLGHTGELPGYNTSVLYDPKSETTAVVMVNSDIPADGKNPAPYVMRQLQAVLS